MSINNSPTQANFFNSQIRSALQRGDWDGLYQTAIDWLKTEPGHPAATFIQNIACLFINPPSMIQNKRYLNSVSGKDWKAVLSWFMEFQTEAEKHNPYFQAMNFILQPRSNKKEIIEAALQEHPNQPELLFLQAIAMQDRSGSVEKLKLAVAGKREFPAALYLLGIFSLQMNDVQTAESYLKQAAELAPNFLEAHYQLGSLYTLYIPEAVDQAAFHFQKVIELDPEGEAGKDAKKVLEDKTEPQFGQRIASRTGGRRGGMSMLTILGISLLTVVLFSGPVASLFKVTNPTIGILAGLFVFVGLYSAFGRRK